MSPYAFLSFGNIDVRRGCQKYVYVMFVWLRVRFTDVRRKVTDTFFWDVSEKRVRYIFLKKKIVAPSSELYR